METYKVKEIYYTLQGEGAQTGRPAVFCRFTGCNLWTGREEDRHKAICQFCDTDFWGTDGVHGGRYSAEELAAKIASLWPAAVHQGQRYVVVVTGTSAFAEPHQGLVVDLLPAGLEIENTRLRNGGDVGDFAWLPPLTDPRHLELRDDRFVAAYDLDAERKAFTAAYIVLAVTRGDFVQPAVYAEDMYQPYRFARGPVGRLTVAAAPAAAK